MIVDFLYGEGLKIPCNVAVSFEVLMIFLLPLGQSNNNSDTCAEFRIKYVGAIEKLKLSEGKSLEGPLDLINYIDVAQVKKKKKFYFLRFWGEFVALERDDTLPVSSLLLLKARFYHC